MKQRIQLDELSQGQRTELERKYVHYVPDIASFVYSKICETEHVLETEQIKGGWHLIFSKGYPYLISHSTLSFVTQAHGGNAWYYHVKENSDFMETCYSNKELGAKGTFFDEYEYSKLSPWIVYIAAGQPIFIGSKGIDRGKYYINIACGSVIKEIILADLDTGPYPDAIYGFRPVVALSPEMYLVTGDDCDGSTPKKGMLLEPADNYDPANFASLKPGNK